MNVFVLSIRGHVTGCDSEINAVKHNFEGPISVFKFKFRWIGNQFGLKLLQFFKFIIKFKAIGVKFFLKKSYLMRRASLHLIAEPTSAEYKCTKLYKTCMYLYVVVYICFFLAKNFVKPV